MELSNYSMKDLIQEWIMDRARAPLLLQRAVALTSVEEVVAFAVESGVPHGAIMFALRKAGCVEVKPREPKPDDALRRFKREWKKITDDQKGAIAAFIREEAERELGVRAP